MEALLVRVAENLIGRLHGPLMLRLYLQPAMAAALAVRAGLRDARLKRPAFLSRVWFDPHYRREGLSHGWKDVGRVFVLALTLDIIYQLYVMRWIYPGEALIVAAILALVPYTVIRGLVTRIACLGRPARESG